MLAQSSYFLSIIGFFFFFAARIRFAVVFVITGKRLVNQFGWNASQFNKLLNVTFTLGCFYRLKNSSDT